MSRAGSAEAPRPGLSLGTAGFEAESHAYIQGRLRTVFAVAAAGATGLLAVAHVLEVVNGVWTVDGLLAPAHVVHVASCVATAACWLVLRRTTLSRRGIEVFDALSLYIAVATCVAVYAFAYRRGPETLPGIPRCS
jgi:hypothetical protein